MNMLPGDLLQLTNKKDWVHFSNIKGHHLYNLKYNQAHVKVHKGTLTMFIAYCDFGNNYIDTLDQYIIMWIPHINSFGASFSRDWTVVHTTQTQR